MELTLTGIFIAGVFTFFTPCVLPLIPIYLAALLGGDLSNIDRTGRGQLIIRSVFFSFGFIAVFTLLGLGAAGIGAVLQENKALMQLIGAAIVAVFGLKMLGVIRIPLLDRVVRGDDTKLTTRFGVINAFIMGVFFAAGWSPCVGPILGSILTYTASQTSDPATGALYLTIYGLGFAVPLLGVATFAQAGVSFIRKTSKYLPILEKGVGAFLLLIALTMLLEPVYDRLTSPSPQPETASSSDQIKPAMAAGSVEPGEYPLMVEFYSRTCHVCKKMMPIVDSLTNECNQNMIEIRKIDVSRPENKHFVSEFHLVGVPTFVFIDQSGAEVARLVGKQTEEALRQAISALRGKPCPGVGPLPDDYLQQVNGQSSDTCGSSSSSSNTCTQE